jgi:hypothetical protein
MKSVYLLFEVETMNTSLAHFVQGKTFFKPFCENVTG